MSNLHKVILSKVYKMHNLHNYTSLDYIYTLCIIIQYICIMSNLHKVISHTLGGV